MILKALKYTRFNGEPREWKLLGKENTQNKSFAYFGSINLLVGKNSSGKSRTLHIINVIADLFAERITIKEATYATGTFQLLFENDNILYEYLLDFKDKVIINESLLANNITVLDRAKNVALNPSDMSNVDMVFDNQQLAICALRSIEQSIYSQLVYWGESLKSFMFSNQHEKTHPVKNYRDTVDKEHRIENILVHTFYKGREEYGKPFISEIKKCMKELGYHISNIDIEKTPTGYSLCVEEDRRFVVSQSEMSQGMFRALSLFIQITYMRLSEQSVCVLLDDMGEGLDYDRSKGLIEMLINRLKQSNIQLFMTTNDRYVMNRIPLHYWSVIERDHSLSVIYNYENSKEIFDDFRYTGLNNFDFLATDFYRTGFGDIEIDE